MTCKDYELIASLIRDMPGLSADQREVVAFAFAGAFTSAYENFRVPFFLDAAIPKER